MTALGPSRPMLSRGRSVVLHANSSNSAYVIFGVTVTGCVVDAPALVLVRVMRMSGGGGGGSYLPKAATVPCSISQSKMVAKPLGESWSSWTLSSGDPPASKPKITRHALAERLGSISAWRRA